MSKNTHQQLARISELDTAIDAAADKGDDAFFAAVAAKDEYIDSQGIDRDRLEVTGREAQGNVSNYIERPHQVQYVIHSLSESDVDLDGAVGAFWSNEDGWGSLQSATLFSTKERMSLNLPMSAKLDAEWMLAEEARDLDANRNPQGNVTELAKYVADFERGLIASRGAINDANFDQKRLAASKDAIASGSDHDLKECLIWWTEAIASGLLFHVQGNVEHATHNRYALGKSCKTSPDVW
ncbi:hypothetical protein [Acidovorax sp. HMWF018]|uniref:hypothetical protein n=1 Tax=Acidovorax sp. HMWF018 TaxID=2056855 RepID=UPI0018EE8BB3|nr:hypothetical protein [Acidovorax sp. HMWF018]